MTVRRGSFIRSVGFVGLGKMGEPMARRLANLDLDVLVFDRDPDLAAHLTATSPLERAGSLRELSKNSDVVIAMLPTSEAVRGVTLGDELQAGGDCLVGEAGSTSMILDMGSSEPMQTRRLGQELARCGTTLLDAPVSGGVRGAEKGDLTIMVGGDTHSLESCRPLFEELGHSIIPTGPLGTAHAMKALNNLLSAIGLIGALEVMLAGRAFGLESHTMLQVLNNSSGRNFATETKIDPFVLSRSFSSGFTLDLLMKDIATALGVPDSSEPAMPLSQTVSKVCRDALEHLGPGHDHTEISRWLEDRSGLCLD